MDHASNKYEWFAPGDLNGFFGLMFDNLTVLSFLAGTLIFVFQFPADIVYSKMFPGTAFGVLVGDLVYTWLAFRLSRRTGSRVVTAMPLGTRHAFHDRDGARRPGTCVCRPEGRRDDGTRCRDHDLVHRHGDDGHDRHLQGGLLVHWAMGAASGAAGRAPGLAGRHRAGADRSPPLVDVFGMPVIGMLSLGLILYSLVARVRLPGDFPSVLAASFSARPSITCSGPPAGWGHVRRTAIGRTPFWPADPHPGVHERVRPRSQYLPITIPFGLLTVIGGINVTESSRVAGTTTTREDPADGSDRHSDRGNLRRRGAVNPVHRPARVQADGRRAGYTLLTGLFIGLGGMLGFASFFVELIPRAVLAPILIFVALDIVAESFRACPARTPRRSPSPSFRP